ncbi:MAG: hypothetical protein NC095_04870 [Muribaculum sp.]|nr:hypothetical protein [Muribaculum sp.]
MKSIIIIAIVAIAVFFLIRILTMKMTVKVCVAYAGAAKGKPAVICIPSSRNKTIYTVGEDIVDMSDYHQFLIKGNSLKPKGLLSDTYVYTSDVNTNDCSRLKNKFVIFEYDINRQKAEHPEAVIVPGTHKARWMVDTISTRLNNADFMKVFSAIIDNDSDIVNNAAFLNHLWKKYKFASDFYGNDNTLIVSLTYKNGENKSYSFHSPEFLRGVVEYRSIPSVA